FVISLFVLLILCIRVEPIVRQFWFPVWQRWPLINKSFFVIAISLCGWGGRDRRLSRLWRCCRRRLLPLQVFSWKHGAPRPWPFQPDHWLHARWEGQRSFRRFGPSLRLRRRSPSALRLRLLDKIVLQLMRAPENRGHPGADNHRIVSAEAPGFPENSHRDKN